MRTVHLGTRVARRALAVPLVVVVGAVGIGALAPAEAGYRHRDLTYEITELTPLGDVWGSASSINNRGWVTGLSQLTDEGVVHATLWRDGKAIDLETLGGPNSAVLWPVKNDRGMVVGVTETADIDPRDEAWSCSVFFGDNTEHACVGFVWERNEMRPLPTFGGTHGFAAGVNNRGQVVGWAELDEPDDTCNEPQVLGFRAALWDTRRDTMRELPPLTDDHTASSATAINDRGQVVGISGICSNAVGGFSAISAVLWERGKVVEIGDIGGDAWNTPTAINSWGVVVGFANQPEAAGDDFFEEAFVWTRWGGIQALSMLKDDVRSQALGVNNRGQIVGLSKDAGGNNTAVIWERGELRDLNKLAPGYGGDLQVANDVNHAGVITGTAESVTGQTVPFVATPRRR